MAGALPQGDGFGFVHSAAGSWGVPHGTMPPVHGGMPQEERAAPSSPAQTPLPAPQDLSRGSTPALVRDREFFWHQLNNRNAAVPLTGEGSSVNNASSCGSPRRSQGAGPTVGLRRGWQQHRRFLQRQNAPESPCRSFPLATHRPCRPHVLSRGFILYGARRKLSPCWKTGFRAG